MFGYKITVMTIRDEVGWVPGAFFVFHGPHGIVRRFFSEEGHFENEMDASERTNQLIPQWFEKLVASVRSRN
jgi:hypothetical protein